MVHVFRDDALGQLDAVGVADRIRSGEVSRREVLEAAIARVSEVDRRLHAVRVDCFDQARSARPMAGPFSGVPSFIKDNTDVAGLPTTHGSAAFTQRPVGGSFASARQYLDQGFVLLGKSTMPELGLTASTEFVESPPTRNPWNPDISVGASSGGAAALVASGAVPIAHANDGGGSIRIPAAATGLVGLKYTRARTLDRPGVRSLPVNLVSEGALARSVRDVARFTAGMERSYRNPDLPPVGMVTGPADRRLRIGMPTTTVSGDPVDPAVDRLVRAAADALTDLGHHVEEIPNPIPPRFVDDFTLYWGMSAWLLVLSMKARRPRDIDMSRLDPVTKGLARMYRREAHRTVPALRRLRAATGIYDAAFTRFDVLLNPVLAHPVPPIGYFSPTMPFPEILERLTRYVQFTPLNNVGGGPGISLPFSRLGDLPGAVHLSAPRGDDRRLLELAYEWEAAHPFPVIHREPTS